MSLANVPFLLFVGTYSMQGSVGVYTYTFNPDNGALVQLAPTAALENPSFVALHPSGKYLYAVQEVMNGKINSFAVDTTTGALTPINEQSAMGDVPCHVSVDASGKWLVLANYVSGDTAAYPIAADGSLYPATGFAKHEGTGPDASRQEGPHAHSANFAPGETKFFVADLGIDRLVAYNIDPETGGLKPAGGAVIAGGSGPRHLTFAPDKKHTYLINEMGNTIVAFDYDAQTGVLTETQTVPTLPADFTGFNTTADIHMSPDGRFLYGSNRGHDSLVIYSVSAETGELTYVGHQLTGGKTPRNFAIDPTGKYLLAANQDSSNIVVFAIDQATGKLTPTGVEAEVSMPVCLAFGPQIAQ